MIIWSTILLNNRLNVWDPLWTKQRGITEEQKCLEALEGCTKIRGQFVVVLVPCASACIIMSTCVCTQGRARVAFNLDLA